MKRSIQDWAAISEIIGGVAVVISLLVLAHTIKENTDTLAAQTWDIQLARTSEINTLIAGSPDLAGIMLRAEGGSSQVSDEEFLRFSYVARMRFGAWEAAFIHFKNDQMTSTEWQTWHKYYLGLLNKPGYREVWVSLEPFYDDRFQQILAADYLQAKTP